MAKNRNNAGKFASSGGAKCVKRAVSFDLDVFEFVEEFRKERGGIPFSTALNKLISETKGPLKPIKPFSGKSANGPAATSSSTGTA